MYTTKICGIYRCLAALERRDADVMFSDHEAAAALVVTERHRTHSSAEFFIFDFCFPFE